MLECRSCLFQSRPFSSRVLPAACLVSFIPTYGHLGERLFARVIIYMLLGWYQNVLIFLLLSPLGGASFFGNGRLCFSWLFYIPRSRGLRCHLVRPIFLCYSTRRLRQITWVTRPKFLGVFLTANITHRENRFFTSFHLITANSK